MKKKSTNFFVLKQVLPFFFFAFFSFVSKAQLPAFPGAEGYGKYTTGGRGTAATPTTVFEVTNLNDDNNPGTLRYAVTNGGSSLARTVVFRVSGTIHLTSQLTIRSNTTIAGQTAPGGGICIADMPVVISGDNVILRYIRIRLGDRHQNLGMVDGSGNGDVLGNLGGKKIIIDHCSISWSADEAVSIYRGDSITLQWNIVSEPLNYSYHFESGGSDYQEHGYGGIWGSKNGSFHHNLIMHVKGRAPRFGGNSTYPAGVIEKNDFRNNVIYNWISYSTNGGEGGNYNLVNNYYKYGPSTASGNTAGVPKRGMIMNPSKSADFPYPKLYVSGNYVDGYPDITASNWKGIALAGGSLADTNLLKVTTAFPSETIPAQSAQDAYNQVLQSAGAILPNRDTLDMRLVNDVINRTGRIIDVQGGYPHGTPYAQTVNAWPALASTPAPADNDHDGMSDSWETANGLNPNDAVDRNGIAANGYTNLENYLNGLSGTPVITIDGSLNNFTQSLGVPSAAQQYIISGSSLTQNITITPPASFQVSGNGGSTWLDNTTPLVITHTNGTINNKAVSVRLNAAATGTYTGNIVHTSADTATINIPVSGTTIASTSPPGTAVIVALDGTGTYSSVQAAINAAPTGLTSPYIIFIKNGRYYEKINIPSNKPFIHLAGESVANTILYYDDGASDPLPGGGTVGTQNSASFTVNAADFAAFNITFANTYGDGTQAVAVLVNNDRAVFKNCRFLGNQDTLYIKGGGTPRHYFKNCYIDGNVDFIFGSSVALFDSTVVYAKSRTNAGSSYITAANTPAGQTYGYVFRDSEFPNNTGGTTYFLGRPWQNSNGSSPIANNKVVLLNSRMGTTIKPEGWSAWDAGTNTSLIYYGEYGSENFNGTPIDISQRVPWSYQLTTAEAATYTNANLFGSWDPCTVATSVCKPAPRDIAISNFRSKKDTTNHVGVLDWNISWAMDQIKYELYRSSDRNTGYTKISEVMATNDTAFNFQLTDPLPVAGSSYFYYLLASKTGYASHITDTVEMSSVPTIVVSGVLQSFIQNLGTPSTSQNLTVSGQNITDVITIVPPVNFDVSVDAGSTWVSNPSTVNLTPSGNTITAREIAVRLNAVAEGTYTDSIGLTSSGAITAFLKVTGTTAVIAPSTTVTLQHWPFTMNAADSAGLRSPGVTASTPTFNNLNSSNGTTVPTIPAYSLQFGQAFGSTANGDGSWTTALGGPGGTLRRTYYEEFKVTASNGYEVRVDSIYTYAAFYNTSSNTRLAVVYSLSGFVSDSTDVFTIPGGFNNPVTLANQTNGPTNPYALSVAGLNGITLQPGETLTFRFYFSCGSGSPGRYAMLKDTRVVGEAKDLTSVVAVLQHWPLTQNNNDSIAVRSVGVTASATSFNNLTVSNGTTVPTIPAYSSQYGQAFGTTANGDGSWGTAAGGPGGTLKRHYYEQFTVTANSGYAVRIDSIFATSAFYNTSSNTKLAVVYSLTGFVSDSVDLFTVPGGFVNPIVLANQTGGPANMYGLSVAGPAGITLQPGQTLSFRFYFSCGSSSPGRYAMLKDVKVIGNAASAGTSPLIATNGTLNNFSQIIGTASPVQTYTVSGTDLTGNITITPPTNYEVSANGGTTWFSNTTPLVLTNVGGTIVNTIISVRLNATAVGNYSGSIIHESNGAANRALAVTGETKPLPLPAISITAALSSFSQAVGTTSAVQTYTISGNDLTGDLSITPPVSYEVSANGGTTWFTNTSPLIISPDSGTIPNTTISVRLNAAATGTFSGDIMHTSNGVTTQNVAVTGTTINPPLITSIGVLTAFTQTIGAPSASQTYTIGGTNLSAANITITAPAGYEISADGGATWFTAAAPLVLPATSGTINNTTITIKLNASTTGNYNGNIVHTSSGAATVNIAITGATVAAPVITVSSSLTEFLQTTGAPSAEQNFTVEGSNLTGAMSLTAPAGYELAQGNSGWINSGDALMITPAAGNVNATVRVRLNATTAGQHNGTINIKSNGADDATISLTGYTYPSMRIAPNPAADMMNIYHPAYYTVAFVTIYNINGVKLGTWSTEPLSNKTTINIQKLVAGMYFAEYRRLNERTLIPFVKQ